MDTAKPKLQFPPRPFATPRGWMRFYAKMFRFHFAREKRGIRPAWCDYFIGRAIEERDKFDKAV